MQKNSREEISFMAIQKVFVSNSESVMVHEIDDVGFLHLQT